MKTVRLYAQVLVDVALAAGSGLDLAQIIRELTDFSQIFSESKTLIKVFQSPAVSDQEKQKIIQELSVKSSLSQSSARFVSILTKQGRINHLPEIVKEAELIEVERRGGLIGEMVSALPLEEPVVKDIVLALTHAFKRPIQLKPKVDGGLIAGVKVTVGGATFDGSVKGKLEKLSSSV